MQPACMCAKSNGCACNLHACTGMESRCGTAIDAMAQIFPPMLAVHNHMGRRIWLPLHTSATARVAAASALGYAPIPSWYSRTHGHKHTRANKHTRVCRDTHSRKHRCHIPGDEVRSVMDSLAGTHACLPAARSAKKRSAIVVVVRYCLLWGWHTPPGIG